MLPDLAALEHFHLLRPWALLLLVPGLWLVVMLLKRQQQKDMFGGIIAPHLLEHLRLDRTESRWLSPTTFTVALTIAMTLIVAGPSWRQQPSPLSQDEAAMVVLVDVSSSMEQTDIQPSRLQRAKQKASDLLALRPDKQSAVVVYAGSAHTVLTLTADREILDQYLAAITPQMMPRPGKFPEYALPLVDEILRDTTAPASVVLLTDGLGADSLAAFAGYFDARQHQLLVLGVGSERDEDGLIPLERRNLEQLARASGGHYFSLTVDDKDVRALERRVESHYVIIDDDALPWLDGGYPLVFLCLALFLMWFRKGWTLTWTWLLVPVLLWGTPDHSMAAEDPNQPAATTDAGFSFGQWFADLWMTPDQQGRWLLQRGDYRAAARHFQDPMWKGIAFYYNEDFMEAAEYFSRTDSDDALFNEANARAHARDFLRAVKRYDQLLARNPDYPGARENRDTVQAVIDEINRMSESQQGEEGSSEEKQMGGDDAIPAEGAEKISFDQIELKQYTAEEILESQATRDMWLRGVQQDPANFLATKFSMQLQRREQP
ncbi:VWA domain-containing protein [Pseudohalioglobus sediminis]|uniref:VWA domain-containing protein n=1 Tax=Pseudohalioglobus sediminis TaxID=2606449 RepID=A0A5B0WXI8_9GAMM|nr:VWA domain-containing protein [Pseudohalioglobus sediminis]KAA1191772.1 VWA domain-containing protein [Pseudohalioglobus sediminis]